MGMLIFLQKPTNTHDYRCQMKWNVKPWILLKGDIENQVTLLVGDYKNPT